MSELPVEFGFMNIAAAWEDLSSRFIDLDLSEARLTTFRDLFYAGAYAWHRITNNIADQHSDHPEAMAVLLKALVNEVMADR